MREAILHNDLARIRAFGTAQERLNEVGFDGLTPLLFACSIGRKEAVSELLNMKVDKSFVDVAGRNALHVAMAEGHHELVPLLMKSEPSLIKATTKSGNSPLHRGAAYGHVRCVQSFLSNLDAADKKDIINAQNKLGETPITRAGRWGHTGVITTLLAHLADPNIPDFQGYTAYAWSLRKNFVQIQSMIESTPQHETWKMPPNISSLLAATSVAIAPPPPSYVPGTVPPPPSRDTTINNSGLGIDPAALVSGFLTKSAPRTLPLPPRNQPIPGPPPPLSEADTALKNDINRTWKTPPPPPLNKISESEESTPITAPANNTFEQYTAQVPLRVEGWLAKEGSMFKTWKNRWFILEGRTIEYYKTESKKKQKGTILLGVGSDVIIEEKYSKPYCFTLIAPHRKYILQAANEEDMAEWIEAILTNLELCSPDDVVQNKAIVD